MAPRFDPSHTPAGRPARRGPGVFTWQEALSVVAPGRGTADVTAEVADFYA
ncbi:hypothetical protein [Streptomyces sp. NPDC058382]|uniref:hypothetical protein n=1 Tax=unclassified Streptomyces TaxID=2593676 RepID=UPI00364140A5